MIFSIFMGTNAHQRIELKPEFKELTDDDLGVIVEAAHRRAALVGELKAALLAGDNDLALKLARKVAGLEETVL
jgi:hypothetical protein